MKLLSMLDHGPIPLESSKDTFVTPVSHGITRAQREERNGHRGGVLWLTGLPASGKSTLAMRLERRLFAAGWQAYVLDGDNVRLGLCADLGFGTGDRSENLRRAAEVSKMMADCGIACIAAFISPLVSDRRRVRDIAGADFHEIHVHADLRTCEARDPKGHYRKARAGLIAQFSGISAPYEAPLNPDLVVDTVRDDVEICVRRLFEYAVHCLSATAESSIDGGVRINREPSPPSR
jgi:bifunctional enzyme CysN/CysC